MVKIACELNYGLQTAYDEGLLIDVNKPGTAT